MLLEEGRCSCRSWPPLVSLFWLTALTRFLYLRPADCGASKTDLAGGDPLVFCGSCDGSSSARIVEGSASPTLYPEIFERHVRRFCTFRLSNKERPCRPVRNLPQANISQPLRKFHWLGRGRQGQAPLRFIRRKKRTFFAEPAALGICRF